MAKMTVEMPKKKTKSKVSHIHIKRMENGYEVRHEMEPTSSPNMMMGHGPSPAAMGFNGKKMRKQMLDHVASLADQMHDMPENEPETAQAEPTGVASSA